MSRTTGSGYALRLRFEVRLHGPCMRCLEDAGRVRGGRRPRGRPARRRRRAALALPGRRASWTCARGRATPWRWRCPRRSSAARTAWASARSAAPNLNDEPDHAARAPRPTRAGRSCPSSSWTEPGGPWRRRRPLLAFRRHGRPQATTVALAHEQAALPAQAVGAQPRGLPALRSARMPHRVCGECGTYAGREVVAPALRTPTTSSRAPVIALDANGADAGPAVVAEGARLSGERVLVFGPRGRSSRRAPRWSTRRSGSAATRSRSAPCASNPEASIVQAAAAVAEGRAEALVSAGSTGPTLAAATLAIKRLRGVHRPALAVLVPMPGAPGPAARRRRQRGGAARAPGPVRLHGRRLHGGGPGRRAPAGGPALGGRGAGKGTPDVLEARERLAAGPLDFAGNVEGFDLTGGHRRRDRDRRLHRQRRAQGDGGHLEDGARGHPRRDPLRARVDRRRAADPRRGRAGCATSSTPSAWAARSCSACAGRWWSATAASARAGSPPPSGLARRAVDERMVERTHAALESAGALRSAPAASFAPE